MLMQAILGSLTDLVAAYAAETMLELTHRTCFQVNNTLHQFNVLLLHVYICSLAQATSASDFYAATTQSVAALQDVIFPCLNDSTVHAQYDSPKDEASAVMKCVLSHCECGCCCTPAEHR